MVHSLVYMSASVVPSPAANSVHVMKMSAAFAAAGLNTTLVGLGDGNMSAGAVRAAYGVPDSFTLRLVRKSGRLNYRLRYAFGILLGGWVPRDGIIYTRVPKIAAMAALLRRPCVLELHHPPTKGNEAAVRRHLTARTGGRLVVITQTLKDWVVESLGVASDRVLVAHDGADPCPAGVKPALPPSKRCRIGYLGHLYAGKGVEIIAQVAPRMPEFDFIVVGGLEKDVAQWKAHTAGIGNLRFIGQVPHTETPSWLRSFDIALLPNQLSIRTIGSGAEIGRWTSPLKAFEYMAAGLPIIASDIENLREVFRHEDTALLCPPEDPDAWAATISRLASDAAYRKAMGARAAEHLEGNYTWVRRAHELERFCFRLP